MSTFSLSFSLSCGSSKQPSRGQLRGRCLTSQAENGPCPFLPCSIYFPSCLSFVVDTACNKKSQHIYGVADLAGTQVFYLPGTKQLCYSLTIHKPRTVVERVVFEACLGACMHCRLVYGMRLFGSKNIEEKDTFVCVVFFALNSDSPLTLGPIRQFMASDLFCCVRWPSTQQHL